MIRKNVIPENPNIDPTTIDRYYQLHELVKNDLCSAELYAEFISLCEYLTDEIIVKHYRDNP